MNKVEHFRVATSPFKTRYDNFIGGKFVAPNAGRYFENTSPVTGQVLCEIARSDASDVEAHRARWVHRVPPEAVVGRAASSSRVGLLDDAARDAYLDSVRDLLDTHPDTRGRDELEIDYVTQAWRLVPRR